MSSASVSTDGSVLYAFDSTGNTLLVISTATNTIIKTFSVNNSSGVAVSSNRLYVSNSQDDTVTVFTL